MQIGVIERPSFKSFSDWSYFKSPNDSSESPSTSVEVAQPPTTTGATTATPATTVERLYPNNSGGELK
jgi:hypothetical protein